MARKCDWFSVNGQQYDCYDVDAVHADSWDVWHDVLGYADKVYRGKAIPYSTGELTDTANYFYVYVFTAPKFKQIKIYTSVYGSDIAEIAFYNSTTIGGNSFMQEASKVNTSGDNNHHYNMAEIPEGCQLVAVTSRDIDNQGAFIPRIWADNTDGYQGKENEIIKNYDICYGYRDAATDLPTDQRYVARATTSRIRIPHPHVQISANFSKGYQISVTNFVNNTVYYSSSWYSSLYDYTILGDSFNVGIKRVVNGSEVPLNITGLHDVGLEIKIVESIETPYDDTLLRTVAEPGINYTDIRTNTRRYYSHIFGDYKYLCHMLIDNMDRENVIVPCQSLANIEIAHRLGYKLFELNVHKTATANVWVCMHGVSGKIGNELVARNGTDISNIKFEDVTESTFRDDYVYRTTEDKYRTHITFLDEALKLLKRYNMTPFIQFPNGQYQIVDYIRNIVGDNFVLYVNDTYYLNRYNYDGIFNIYKSVGTDEIRDLCRGIGAPFIYSITAEQCASYTDEQLKAMIDGCHAEGCMIAYPCAYVTPAVHLKLMDMGFDGCGPAYEVEDFTGGNMASLHDNNNFTAFQHGGSVSGGVLSLANGDTIGSNITGTAPFLSKGSLRIKFTGTLKISLGERYDEESVTGTDREIWISSWFMNANPNFTAEAVGAVTVQSCTYEASEC